MNVRLELSHAQANVRRVVLRSDTLVGRARGCNLRIASSEVSRRHCKIILTDDSVLVRDLGSSNGTFVDGVQIEPETDVAVAPGSQLSVGGVNFIVHFDAPVLTDSDFEPDATGSTIDYPHGLAAAEAQQPPLIADAGAAADRSAARDTVYSSHPDRTAAAAATSESDPGDDLHDFLRQFEA